MKDILLITLEYPPMIGGVAMYYLGLAKALGQNRIAVIAGACGTHQEKESVPVIRTSLLASWGPFRWWKSVWEMWRAQTLYPARFIGVGQLLPIGIAALILHGITGIRYIVFCHGMDILQAASYTRKKITARIILRHASLVVVNSESTRSLLRTHFGIPSHACVVVYPCVDIKEIPSHFRFDDSPTILSVARLVARKGIDRLIKALPALLLKIPSAQYIVIGDGPEREHLVRLAQRTIFFDRDANTFRTVLDAGKVRFLGALNRQSVLQWYQSCDVFALPVSALADDIEGFGIVFLEAGAFGKPSVAGATGGVTEAVIDGETGILVQPEDGGALTDALVRLLRDSALRERLGAQAHTRVMKQFQWEYQSAIFLEALSRISG